MLFAFAFPFTQPFTQCRENPDDFSKSTPVRTRGNRYCLTDLDQRKSDTKQKVVKRGAVRYPSCCSAEETGKQRDKSLLHENLSTELLREALSGTVLRDESLVRVFSAARDGFDDDVFFAKNRLGFGGTPSLVIGQTRDLQVFGAFNPVGFDGREDYRDSVNAFLFVIDATSGKLLRSRTLAEGKSAVFDFEGVAIRFGAASLLIPMNAGTYGLSSNQAMSELGIHYEELPGGIKSLFGQRTVVTLNDLEVWVEEKYVRQAREVRESQQNRMKGPLGWLNRYLQR